MLLSRRDSLTNSYSVPVAAGLLATCINSGSSGFRPRDAKFYIELLVNWLSYGLSEPAPVFANSQISRILEGCAQEGYLKVKTGKQSLRYHFTRAGLFEFSRKLRGAVTSHRPEYFSFLIYFIETYGDRVKEIILSNGSKAPPALMIEIESLFKRSEILTERIRWIDMQILKLKERIDSSLSSCVFAKKAIVEKKSVAEIAVEVEKRWPYALNSIKNFSEVIHDLSGEYQIWELTQGGRARSELIWNGQLEMLENYRRQIFHLQET